MIMFQVFDLMVSLCLGENNLVFLTEKKSVAHK